MAFLFANASLKGALAARPMFSLSRLAVEPEVGPVPYQNYIFNALGSAVQRLAKIPANNVNTCRRCYCDNRD